MKSKKHSILLYVISGVLLVLTVMMGIVLWLIMNLEPQPSHVLKVDPMTGIEQVVEQSTHHGNKRDQTIVTKEKVVEQVISPKKMATICSTKKNYTPVVEEFEDKGVQLLTDMGETDSFESKDASDELLYLLNLS